MVFNRVALFYAKKLRLYESSPVSFISGIITTFALLVITAISFAAINYAVYKTDPKLFSITSEPSFSIFVYYSFKNLFLSSINEITPVAGLSRAVSLAGNLFFFFLASILVSLVFQVRTQRYSTELNDAISGVENEGLEMERFIRREYKLDSIDDAMAELEKGKAAFLKFLVYLTSGLK